MAHLCEDVAKLQNISILDAFSYEHLNVFGESKQEAANEKKTQNDRDRGGFEASSEKSQQNQRGHESLFAVCSKTKLISKNGLHWLSSFKGLIRPEVENVPENSWTSFL